MSNLEKINKRVEFTNPVLLSKQDSAEVYKVTLENDYAILKIFSQQLNFWREIIALNELERKNIQTPKIYSFSTQKENTESIPFYMLQEFLPAVTLLETFSTYDYKEKCNIVYECGRLLGKINTSMSESELEKSQLWKYADTGAEKYDEYSWVKFCTSRIPRWLKNIKREDGIDYDHLADVIINSLENMKDEIKIGLLHRDYGFRNILETNGNVTNVIDFEFAAIGDILSDVSKFIFNDLNFDAEEELRNYFLKGWGEITKVDISSDRLWIYLAIEGLAAVQWVDKQKSEEARLEKSDYRNKGKNMLLQACEVLEL